MSDALGGRCARHLTIDCPVCADPDSTFEPLTGGTYVPRKGRSRDSLFTSTDLKPSDLTHAVDTLLADADRGNAFSRALLEHLEDLNAALDLIPRHTRAADGRRWTGRRWGTP